METNYFHFINVKTNEEVHTVAVANLPKDALIEIEAIAVAD